MAAGGNGVLAGDDPAHPGHASAAHAAAAAALAARPLHADQSFASQRHSETWGHYSYAQVCALAELRRPELLELEVLCEYEIPAWIPETYPVATGGIGDLLQGRADAASLPAARLPPWQDEARSVPILPLIWEFLMILLVYACGCE